MIATRVQSLGAEADVNATCATLQLHQSMKLEITPELIDNARHITKSNQIVLI